MSHSQKPKKTDNASPVKNRSGGSESEGAANLEVGDELDELLDDDFDDNHDESDSDNMTRKSNVKAGKNK
jgi:hypothetical protein